MVDIDLGPRLDLAFLDQLVTVLRNPGSAVFIDTSRLEWVEPCGIATLLAYIHLLMGDGLSVMVSDYVLNEDVETYLQRVDFYRVLGKPKEERFSRRDSSGRFIEAEIIDCAANIDRVAGKIAEIFLKDMDLKNYMSYMIREIIANAVEHSQSPFGAAVCAQYWPQLNRAQFCVSDGGIGFRQHLSSKYNVDSDTAAIELALQRGVTGAVPGIYGRSFHNVGYGLYVIRNMVAKSSGSLKIISGDGLFFLRNGRVYGRRPLSGSWPGSVVVVELNTDMIGGSFSSCLRDILRESEGSPASIDFE